MLIAVFVILLLLSGYFSSSETAYSTMNKMRIKSLADDGNKKASKAMKISANFERALVWLLVGNNIVNIAISSIATVFFARQVFVGMDEDLVALLTTLITTGIVVIFGEILPKSLAQDRGDTLAMAYSGSTLFFMKIFSPIISFFNLIIKGTTKIFGKDEQPTMTEEELYDLIDTIEEEGVFDEEQSDLFKSALDFSDKTVKDIMIMKNDIFAIDVSMSNDEVLEYILNINYSRLPVYENDIDNIIGVIQIRNFLKAYQKDKSFNIRDIMAEPFYADPNADIDELLSTMRQQRIHLAIVGIEGEKIYGIVTIEDFLEELVGDIWDESDVVDNTFVNLGGNRYRVDAKMNLSMALERMGIKDFPKKGTQKPIISWVIETLGHFPEEDEEFLYNETLEVKIDEKTETTVSYVIFRFIDEELEEELEELEELAEAQESTEQADPQTEDLEVNNK